MLEEREGLGEGEKPASEAEVSLPPQKQLTENKKEKKPRAHAETEPQRTANPAPQEQRAEYTPVLCAKSSGALTLLPVLFIIVIPLGTAYAVSICP